MEKKKDNRYLHEVWKEHISMCHIVSELRNSTILNPVEIQFKEGSFKENPYLYYFPEDIKSAIGFIEREMKQKKPKNARVAWSHEMDNATITIMIW